MNYLFDPSYVTDAALRHCRDQGTLENREYTISLPNRTVTGPLINSDEITCSTFLEEVGLTTERIRELAVPTEVSYIMYVGRPQPRAVNYAGSNNALRDWLQEFADRRGVNLNVVSAERSCYNETCTQCEPWLEGPFDDEAVTIYLNCLGSSRQPLTRTTLYGIELPQRGALARSMNYYLEPSPGAEVVRDYDGQPVAEVRNGDIHFLVNIDPEIRGFSRIEGSSWRNLPNFMSEAFHHAFTLAQTQRQARVRMVELENRVTTLREQLDSSDTNSIIGALDATQDTRRRRALDSEINEHRRTINEYTEVLIRLEREMRDLISRRRVLEEGLSTERRQQLATQIEQLLQTRGVLGIERDGNWVIVHTDLIDIHYNESRHRIGAFEIRLNFNTGAVEMKNVVNFGSRTSYDHPHVSGGSPCWGNVSDGIRQMMRDYELQAVVEMSLQFLQSYNSSGAYISLDYWPKVAQETEDVTIAAA